MIMYSKIFLLLRYFARFYIYIFGRESCHKTVVWLFSIHVVLHNMPNIEQNGKISKDDQHSKTKLDESKTNLIRYRCGSLSHWACFILHKKWSFPLRISSENVTKFGHIENFRKSWEIQQYFAQIYQSFVLKWQFVSVY